MVDSIANMGDSIAIPVDSLANMGDSLANMGDSIASPVDNSARQPYNSARQPSISVCGVFRACSGCVQGVLRPVHSWGWGWISSELMFATVAIIFSYVMNTSSAARFWTVTLDSLMDTAGAPPTSLSY